MYYIIIIGICEIDHFDYLTIHSKPSQETLLEYQKQVDLLKGLAEAEKKVCDLDLLTLPPLQCLCIFCFIHLFDYLFVCLLPFLEFTYVKVLI